MNKAVKQRFALFHPKYWPVWLGIGTLYLCSKLPYRCQIYLGAQIGSLLYYVLKRRRKIAEKNIELCFPTLSAVEQQQLLKDHFKSVGIAVVETAMAWWLSTEELQSMMDFEGSEYGYEALERGNGVLLLGGHYTTIDIVGRLAGLHFPVYVVYRKQKNVLIDYLLKRYRDQGKVYLIDHRNLRKVVTTLQENKVVWYACDQDFGLKRSVFAPFFGISTATLKMPMRIAELSGTQVLPFSHYRKENGEGYRMTLHPPLENFPSGNLVEDATRMNQILEQTIRQHPEQYLWLHRRFKTRPEGEAYFYGN